MLHSDSHSGLPSTGSGDLLLNLAEELKKSFLWSACLPPLSCTPGSNFASPVRNTWAELQPGVVLWGHMYSGLSYLVCVITMAVLLLLLLYLGGNSLTREVENLSYSASKQMKDASTASQVSTLSVFSSHK